MHIRITVNLSQFSWFQFHMNSLEKKHDSIKIVKSVEIFLCRHFVAFTSISSVFQFKFSIVHLHSIFVDEFDSKIFFDDTVH